IGLHFARHDTVGSATEQLEREFFLGPRRDDDNLDLGGLPHQIDNRFHRIGRQCRLENQHVCGEFLDCRQGLCHCLGLSYYTNVVFQRENLAESGAENRLSISQDHSNKTLAALVSCSVIFFDDRNACHSVPLELATLKTIFVNHHTDAATPAILKAAHHASPAVNLNVLHRSHDVARQQNRKVDR